MRRLAILVVLVLGISTVSSTQNVYGAPTPTLNQTITAGTLTTDFLDASRVPVASPSAAFSAKAFSFDCQTGGDASTGTLGTGTQRAYVINPGAANAGWNLTMAATAAPTAAAWTTGSITYDYNDPTTGGCTDNPTGETDTNIGQLTVDPSASTLTTDCLSCSVTNVTKGSSAAFDQGVTDSVTLLSASAASDDNWRGYLTGIGMSQTIPAEQAAGAYTLGMTLTVTAL